MDTASFYLLSADVVLYLHAGFVLFVAGGLLAIIVGIRREWTWIRNPWFRVAHLAAIGTVVLQAWLGMLCPLTRLEVALRVRAGDEATYPGSFIAHWVEEWLYWQVPSWVFIGAYTLFGMLVVGTWFVARPRPFR